MSSNKWSKNNFKMFNRWTPLSRQLHDTHAVLAVVDTYQSVRLVVPHVYSSDEFSSVIL